MGVPLGKVGKVISAFSGDGPLSKYRATELAKKAPGKAHKVIDKLTQPTNYEKIIAFFKRGNDESLEGSTTHAEELEKLEGLITLIINYLTAGNDNDIAKKSSLKMRPANVF